MRQNRLRDFSWNQSTQLFYARSPQVRDAAKFAQQLLDRARSDSGNIAQHCLRLPLAAPLAMEGDAETMRLVANLLDQMQHRRVTVQDARVIFLAEDIKNLFFLGNAGHRLVDDLQRV